MKRMLIAGALALAATGPVLAADLPPPAAPPPPRAPAAYVPIAAPVYNWGGIYLGVNGGGAFGTSNWTASPCPLAGCSTGDFNLTGGLVGGTLGANFQASQFVFGIEADIDWADISGTVSTTSLVCPGCQTSDDWLGTVRGRVGYAFDRVLVFGTAGGAYGDVKATAPATAIPPGGTTTNSEFGWTAGGGLEYAFNDNWTAKVEYLFVDLQNGSYALAAPSTVAVKFQTSLVRAGINFKFNPF
jgi:outer membrane immunogenic protein